MKRLVALATLAWLLTGCQTQLSTITAVTINNQTVTVELADTPTQQVQGLADRASLPAGQGMLFVFPDYQIRSFWMQGMQFPIDIVWISNDRVSGFVTNVPIPTDEPLATYLSDQPVNYVLELHAGWVAEHQIEVGDTVTYTYQ
jgi:uncharacterized protein